MDNNLRKKATKKVDTRMAFYICAIVFAFLSLILLMLSFYLGAISFWLRLPIPVFGMVLAILYLFAFGFPTSGPLSKEWRQAEIEKEMRILYRRESSLESQSKERSEKDKLELKELERLKNKWDADEDFV